MAEKNTHSILESIKKKLHKFDQKPENKIADVSGDFDYVAPVKNDVKKEEPKEELIQAEPEVATNSVPPVVENKPKNEDGLEDFDWDDESSVKTAVEQVTANVQSTESREYYDDFDEDDLEDFEDEIDFDEDDFEEEIEDQVVEETPSLESENEDELSFEGLEEVKEKQEPKTVNNEVEMKELEDLNLDDLELELAKQEKKSEAKPVEPAANQDFGSGDSELDELEREIQRQKEQAEEDAKNPIHLDLEKEMLGLGAFDQVVKEEIAPQEKAEIELEEIEEIAPQEEVSQELPEEELVEETVDSFDDKALLEQIQKESAKAADHLDLPVMPAMPEMPQISLENEISSMHEAAQKQAEIEVVSAPVVQKNLLSETTMKQTTDSVKKLLDAKNVVSGISSFSQSPVLAELATQLLEPKLERWLNDHLAELVEKVVREEIKKIIPKGE